MRLLIRGCRLLGSILLLLGLLLDPISAGAADAPWARIGLVIFGEELPREELRAALARDLGRTVTLLASRDDALPCVTVTWRRESSELAVTYDEPGRGTLARVIQSRATAAQTAQDATVLATSLVRNEADELLGKVSSPPEEGAPSPAKRSDEQKKVDAPMPAPSPPTVNAVERDRVAATASFFYPAATNWNHPHAATRFSLNLLYGMIGELESGVQIGTVNVIVQKQGVATGDMAGAQVGLAFNLAQGRASGFQLALLGNVARSSVEGAQLSGLANISSGPVDGFQIAPVNIAADVRGTQIGVVNVGGKVTGLMLGVVNVAAEVDGAAIGAISVTRAGGVHPVVWGGSALTAGGGFKFATDHTYSIIAAQYAVIGAAAYPANGNRQAISLPRREFVGGGFYIGGHVRLRRMFMDFDLGFSALTATEVTWMADPNGPRPYRQLLLEPRVRAIAGYSFFEHASVFAGGSLAIRAHLVNVGDDTLVSTVPELIAGAQF
jgi:hypothetical protein